MEALIDLLKDIIVAFIIYKLAYYYGRKQLHAQYEGDIIKLKNDYKLKLIETRENAIHNYIESIPDKERSEHEKLLAFSELLQAVDLIEYTYNEFLKYSPKTHEWKIHVIPWRERLGYRVEKARRAINRFHGYS